MYREIAQLLMYGDPDRDSILYRMGELFRRFDGGETDRTDLTREANALVKQILKVATEYGFD